MPVERLVSCEAVSPRVCVTVKAPTSVVVNSPNDVVVSPAICAEVSALA